MPLPPWSLSWKCVRPKIFEPNQDRMQLRAHLHAFRILGVSNRVPVRLIRFLRQPPASAPAIPPSSPPLPAPPSRSPVSAHPCWAQGVGRGRRCDGGEGRGGADWCGRGGPADLKDDRCPDQGLEGRQWRLRRRCRPRQAARRGTLACCWHYCKASGATVAE